MRRRRILRVSWRSSFLSLAFLSAVTLSPQLGQRATAENSLRVGEGAVSQCTGGAADVADIPLYVSADKDVQGLVMIFEWNAGEAVGTDLVPATGAGEALAKAELVVKRVEASFMILSAVLDVDGQGGEKIPAGQNIRVGTAKIRCVCPSQGSRDTQIRLVDAKYATVDGGPLLSNIIVSEGLSIGKAEGLALRNGSIRCGTAGPVPEDVYFACGSALGGNGEPVNPTNLSRGAAQTMNFYYRAPKDGPGNKDKIQGLSMAVKFHTDLTAVTNSFSLAGGALQETNAEFVHIEIDNLVGDGDPCEFTLGALIDAVAPFDGRTLPATSVYKKLFSLDFSVESDAPCGECLWLRFTDGLTGNGDVPVYNVASINFYPVTPKLKNCEICVKKGEARFVRGDCNFDALTSGRAQPVDISDAAAMVGHMFLTGAARFDAPCLDACDANDDGVLNAADIVYLLNYLFVPKSPWPPAPGPRNRGFDPTPDNLDCAAGKLEC